MAGPIGNLPAIDSALPEGCRRYFMDDWLIIGALGILFLIVIQMGRQECRDIQLVLGDQTIVSLHSQDR